MSDALLQLQSRLGYTFRDPALLARALTHPSLANELPELKEANQRLEFLGDAVLQLVLSEEIFRLYPAEREGVLTNRRKKLVEGRFIAELARELSLDESLRVQPATPELARSQSALEDAFEALVAAIYLDAGYDSTRATVLRIYGDLAARLEKTLRTIPRDASRSSCSPSTATMPCTTRSRKPRASPINAPTKSPCTCSIARSAAAPALPRKTPRKPPHWKR